MMYHKSYDETFAEFSDICVNIAAGNYLPGEHQLHPLRLKV